jgi:chemotaxis protein methyltransferase CheR
VPPTMNETTYSDGAGLTLKTSEFRLISQLAHERFGLDLKGGKEALVTARLGKWLRKGGFNSFDEYYRHVLADTTGDALVGLIDSLTTNHTSFLREKAHFEFLTRAASEEFKAVRTLEIWSAACSSGEEPYTIAMCLSDTLAGAGGKGRDFQILATDISTRVLGLAERGIYEAERFKELPDSWRKAYLLRGAGECEGLFKFKPEIRGRISFERLNLIQHFPHGRLFHVIFCRNVMMYFDRGTQQDIVQRLGACLEPRGYLFVGHSESLTGVEHGLQYVRPATYRKEYRGRS